MSDIIRLEESARLSRAVIHGNTVYLAGQLPTDRDADVTVQTQQALEQVDRLLALAGTNRKKILNATIWLKTMADYAAMNAVWDAWLEGAGAPARCCGQVEMADPRLLVEIMITAAI
ncbi:RidA family protein [Burkholderia sp. MR1-5-21]